MYFIDKSFFLGDIFIPNIGEYCDNMNMDLNLFISKFETQALNITLGACLFNQLKDQLEYSPKEKRFVLKKKSETKWEWLINGHTYNQKSSCNCSCGCNEKIWNGIVFTTPILNANEELKEFKESYIAYWIYYQRAFFKNSHSVGTGEAINQTENANIISNEVKRKAAFNKFLELVQIGNGNNVSLYQFLHDYKSLFQGWCPTYFKPLTFFD